MRTLVYGHQTCNIIHLYDRVLTSCDVTEICGCISQTYKIRVNISIELVSAITIGTTGGFRGGGQSVHAPHPVCQLDLSSGVFRGGLVRAPPLAGPP